MTNLQVQEIKNPPRSFREGAKKAKNRAFYRAPGGGNGIMPPAGVEARRASVVFGFIESSLHWRRAQLPGARWVTPGRWPSQADPSHFSELQIKHSAAS
jgi:hypothetical protein